MTGQIPLTPRTAREIINHAAQIFAKLWTLLLPLALIIGFASSIPAISDLLWQHHILADHQRAIVFSLVLEVLSCILFAILQVHVQSHLEGHFRMTTEITKQLLPRLWGFVLGPLLLSCFGWALFSLPLALLFILYPALRGVFVALLVALVLFISLRLSVWLPIFVIEGESISEAFWKSWQRTGLALWQSFVIQGSFVVLALMLGILMGFFHHSVLVVLGSILMKSLILAWFNILLVLLHHDLRLRARRVES